MLRSLQVMSACAPFAAILLAMQAAPVPQAPPARPTGPAAPTPSGQNMPGAPMAPRGAGAGATARARVVIEPPIINFGVVQPGSVHPATFTIRNVGTEPVIVDRAQPSCKCTDVSAIEGQTIPAGGSIELTAALSVPRTPGEKDAKVMITFRGYAGMYEAKMTGDVTLPVRVTPAYIDALKGVGSGTVKLESVDGKPFRVLSAGGKPVEAAAGAGDAPAATHTLPWSLVGVNPADLPQWWVVETDHPDCPLIPLRIRHEATGARFDPTKYQRFWFPAESVVVAGRVKAGTPVDLGVAIEHLNPAQQGRVTNPQWGDVKALRVPGGEGMVELVSATKRGTDFVDVSFRFTPRAGVQTAQYIPVEIETPTGRGLIYVAVVVTP